LGRPDHGHRAHPAHAGSRGASRAGEWVALPLRWVADPASPDELVGVVNGQDRAEPPGEITTLAAWPSPTRDSERWICDVTGWTRTRLRTARRLVRAPGRPASRCLPVPDDVRGSAPGDRSRSGLISRGGRPGRAREAHDRPGRRRTGERGRLTGVEVSVRGEGSARAPTHNAGRGPLLLRGMRDGACPAPGRGWRLLLPVGGLVPAEIVPAEIVTAGVVRLGRRE
jgi:hypothetical protein